MQLLKTKYTSLLSLPLLLVLCVFALPSQKVFAASTYTVNSIGDDSDATPGDSTCETATPGECTLRAAIQEVNAGAGGDTINFGIAGSGVHTLTPASAYATITKAVVINGYSQTGSSANTAVSPNPFNGTLTIEIDGTSAGSSRGLRVGASNVTIKGLVINRFNRYGIEINDFSNVKIEGNYIGTDPTGLIDRGNALSGINHASAGTGVVVGGTTAAARNIISGNQEYAIGVGGNLLVQGNYLGLDSSGTGLLANTGGGPQSNIYIGGTDNTIGGPTTSARNVIAGSNTGILMFFNANNNKIQGNYIGTNYSGNVQSGFGGPVDGVAVIGGQNNLIGGTAEGEGNVIAGNGSGVILGDFANTYLAINNSILGNSIHDNTGGALTALGIDLLGNTNDGAVYSNVGVTDNEAGDADGTSNHLMNFPVISSITSTNGQATITYSLDINDTEPGATGYRVEFFANDSADPSGHGQGQTYIGSDTIAGDVTNRSATITLPSGVSGTKYITATTTMTDNSTDGFGHTSEFALNVQANFVAATGGSSATSSESLADTGGNTRIFDLIAYLMIMSGSIVGYFTTRLRAPSTSIE